MPEPGLLSERLSGELQAVMEIGPKDRPTTAILDQVVPGGRVVFIDIDPKVEAALRARYPGADVRIGDAIDIVPQFAGGNFDVVVAANIITGGRKKLESEFFTLSSQIVDVLRSGGLFVVEETSEGIGGYLTFELIASQLRNQGYEVEIVRDKNRFVNPNMWWRNAVQFRCYKRLA